MNEYYFAFVKHRINISEYIYLVSLGE